MIQRGHLDLELMMKGGRTGQQRASSIKKAHFLQASIYKYIYIYMSDRINFNFKKLAKGLCFFLHQLIIHSLSAELTVSTVQLIFLALGCFFLGLTFKFRA